MPVSCLSRFPSICCLRAIVQSSHRQWKNVATSALLLTEFSPWRCRTAKAGRTTSQRSHRSRTAEEASWAFRMFVDCPVNFCRLLSFLKHICGSHFCAVAYFSRVSGCFSLLHFPRLVNASGCPANWVPLSVVVDASIWWLVS